MLAHLAVAIADGADCLSDLAALREQPALFAAVASRPRRAATQSRTR